MRQGLLSEPKASSGPATMLLAVSRSPSSIPRRSPCPDRCHLPLASLYTSASQTPDSIHPRTDATFLWRPSIHPPLKLPTASTPGPTPPSSGVPLYIRLSNSRQHPSTDRCHFPLASLYTSASQTPDSIHPRTDATFLWRPSIHPSYESASPSRTRSVRLSPPLRYQSSTKESKELTGILPIIIWINAFFSSKRKV